MRYSFVLLEVTPLWYLVQWVSRTPPHHTLPAFLILNGISYIYEPNFIFIKVKNFKFWWMVWIWVHKNSQKYSINMVIFQSLTNRRNFVWEIFGEKIHWAVDYFRIGQVQSFDSWKSRLDLARRDIYVKVSKPILTLKNHYLRLHYFFLQ